jgi:adenine-specific DNA methylase
MTKSMTDYPKRLIEVDLPIKRISAHARREKSIRHGHISTLHIWWARRPLAACRAVLCAALWPDPADEHCPPSFREAAARLMQEFAFTAAQERNVADLCDPITWGKLAALRQPQGQLDPTNLDHLNFLRSLLLDFIADFANWDASTEPHYLAMARALTQAGHEALGGQPGTRPLVVDPFAGGGSIPLEALRVGADAFASDLNPVAVLLNKVVLEYIPKYGQRLADEVRKWGDWIQEQAKKELAEFYPKDPDGATPIAYLWARTIICDGPGCGTEVPLFRRLWLAKRKRGSVRLRMISDPENKRVDFEIVEDAKATDEGEGTVRRGSVTCPMCGYTTPVTSVRRQLSQRKGGTADARLCAVVVNRTGQRGRSYRLPTQRDREVVGRAAVELERRIATHAGSLSLVPNEPVNPQPHSVNRLPMYGMFSWGDVFTPRQALALTTLARLVYEAGNNLMGRHESEFALAVQTCLALAVDRVADRCSSLCRYDPTPTMSGINNTFARQALPIVWDFGEGDPTSTRSGGWIQSLGWLLPVLEREAGALSVTGHVERASATDHPLPDDSIRAFITDPPYYDMISYADLSDFFYVWLRRALACTSPANWDAATTPKAEEIIVEPTPVEAVGVKDQQFYLSKMNTALAEGRRLLQPDGIGLVVFAHKSTSGWEALLQSMLAAGWTVTGSWPIDTEMATKVAGVGQARLMSSIHLVCRPREKPDGAVKTEVIGEWRDVLGELPRRIHEWMPRLAQEGVVGADAIFACLGPALEIYSRYSRVERADGRAVGLREYLEQIWAAVANEALAAIFGAADATGFEEDARLTAIWFWTLKAAENGNGTEKPTSAGRSKAMSGFALEYDAVRKLAQGLGVDLARVSQPGGIVVIKGNVATLNRVAVRERYLIGVQLSLFGDAVSPPSRRRGDPKATMKAVGQRRLHLMDPEPSLEYNPDRPYLPGLEPPEDSRTLLQRMYENGSTKLDRLHQAMLLHARGQTALLRPFLHETRSGQDTRFWTLANVLSALYPANTDEKRWVDGVLARKKGLGF